MLPMKEKRLSNDKMQNDQLLDQGLAEILHQCQDDRLNGRAKRQGERH